MPSKENCSQVGNDFGKKSSEVLAEQVGQSKNQIFRYIRLTELIPELLNMVDEKKIALNPAYELSFLKKEEQTQLLDAMDSEQATPSLSQAQRLKKFSQEGHLSIDVMRAIMGEEKKSDLDKVTFTSDTLRKYFPKSYTPARMQETIIKLLEQWQKKRHDGHCPADGAFYPSGCHYLCRCRSGRIWRSGRCAADGPERCAAL